MCLRAQRFISCGVGGAGGIQGSGTKQDKYGEFVIFGYIIQQSVSPVQYNITILIVNLNPGVPGITGGPTIPGSTAAAGTDRGAGPKPGVDGGNAIINY